MSLQGGSFYISYAEVLSYSKKLFPAHEYPYLVAVYPGSYSYSGLSIQGIDKRQFFSVISAQNGQDALDKDFVSSVFTHEFIHGIETIKNVVDIPYPSPDGASGDVNLGWIDRYGENQSGSKNYMAYYDDILRANVRYQPPGHSGATYEGTFQNIWELNPDFTCLGIYRIRTFLSKEYLVADVGNKNITVAASTASDNQYWVVSYEHENLIRISSHEAPYLFWDIEYANINGKLRLGQYQPHLNYKAAQQFKLERDADGDAQIISMLIDSNQPNQKFAVQTTTSSLYVADLHFCANVKEQKWVFEAVKP